MGDEGNLNYRHPTQVKLRIALFWLPNYFGGNYVGMLNTSEAILKEHNLGLSIWPSSAPHGKTKLDFSGDVVELADYEEIRQAIQSVLTAENRLNHLPIVFGQLRNSAYGITVTDTSSRCWKRPMCMLSPNYDGDYATLVHEAGHAGGLHHDRTSTGSFKRNFMCDGAQRSTMMKFQVQKLAKAFFVT